MTLNGQAPRGDLVRAAVLGLLGTRGPSSRTDIAKVLGVSPATVTQTMKELLSRNLVAELESVPSQGGRPARLLGLVPSTGQAIGAKVTADHVALISVEFDGTITSHRSVDFDPSRPAALDELCRIIDETVAAHDGLLLGVGVGIPGAVDTQDSGIVSSPTLGWDRVPVGRRLRDKIGLPVLVDNDVNTLAAAESLYGTGRRHSSYLVVTIGRGVGCGVVQNGAVIRGAHGGAGEIGHIPVADDGPGCGCGNRACLEAFIGEQGLVTQARQRHAVGPRGNLQTLVRAARDGNDEATLLFTESGALLGRVVAGLVHTLDPETVVIMGEGVDEWPLWERGFEASFRRHLIPTMRDIPYVVEPWTESQWAVGAASLVLASPFDAKGTAGNQGELVRARMQASVAAVPR